MGSIKKNDVIIYVDANQKLINKRLKKDHILTKNYLKNLKKYNLKAI